MELDILWLYLDIIVNIWWILAGMESRKKMIFPGQPGLGRRQLSICSSYALRLTNRPFFTLYGIHMLDTVLALSKSRPSSPPWYSRSNLCQNRVQRGPLLSFSFSPSCCVRFLSHEAIRVKRRKEIHINKYVAAIMWNVLSATFFSIGLWWINTRRQSLYGLWLSFV